MKGTARHLKVLAPCRGTGNDVHTRCCSVLNFSLGSSRLALLEGEPGAGLCTPGLCTAGVFTAGLAGLCCVILLCASIKVCTIECVGCVCSGEESETGRPDPDAGDRSKRSSCFPSPSPGLLETGLFGAAAAELTAADEAVPSLSDPQPSAAKPAGSTAEVDALATTCDL